jgi:hypothetical protein
MSEGRSRGREVAFGIVAVVAGLLLVEGVSSVALFVRESLAEGRILATEESHARFDDELGWVNRPDVHVPDQYGPGVSLTTNARGFRGRDEIDAEVPAGRVRVVCSGDSFTLGYGVADEDTWPAQLGRLDGRIETANLGQGGYGLDQAYLWYLRDGPTIEHQIHVVAFITDDFTRMLRTVSTGYAKPKLGLRDGELEVVNTPLRESSRARILWAQNAHLLTKLRTVALLQRVLGRGGAAPEDVPSTETLGPLVLRLFEDLAERHAADGRALLCVHLPTARDFGGSRGTDEWRTFLAGELGARGIALLDLVAPFRALPYEEASGLFQGSDGTCDLKNAGHYSARGNRFAAEGIYGALAADSTASPLAAR